MYSDISDDNTNICENNCFECALEVYYFIT